jgi:hypothetical protein
LFVDGDREMRFGFSLRYGDDSHVESFKVTRRISKTHCLQGAHNCKKTTHLSTCALSLLLNCDKVSGGLQGNQKKKSAMGALTIGLPCMLVVSW